ncbi:hypothetical protein SSX86_023759 [Deinandra increscens subsp. villosa]|uniref:non-specific serine/threonine protein kinase n=1 Tax=Deinandra increscens subsp. villosa TaxID=3103831 RepID=A0AAP0CMV5_9ASTR
MEPSSAEELLRRIQELESMGQAVHVFDRQYRIRFWNRLAEEIYGVSAAEVFGKTPTEVLVDPKDAVLADYLLERTVSGESWSGEFPVRNKRGETFLILCTNTPFRDENGRSIGGICMFTESRHYHHRPSITSNLAVSKVLTSTEDDDGASPRGHIGPSPFGAAVSLSSSEEEWTGDKQQTASGLAWPWKWKWKWKQRKWNGNEDVVAKLFHFGWQRLHVNQEHQQQQQSRRRLLTWEKQQPTITNKTLTADIHSLQDDEIIWDHLITKRLIGQGSCGTVYHGSWHGSDVAIKLFTYQQSFSDDTMVLFKQEVSLMKRLRHPNILLFMGAVSCSAEHLCIVTEFLPRLVQFLQFFTPSISTST